MRKVLVAIFLMSMGVSAFAAGWIDKDEPKTLACGEPQKVESMLREKGYFHLLDMKNEQGVNEQLWAGGKDMIVTAEHGEKICMVATATEVTYNPVTLKKIIEIFDKSHPEL